MSSFSLISDIPPRYRGPSVITFHPRPRNIISKMLKRRTLREEIQAFYARQVEGSPNIPAYLSNTVYAQLIKQQRLLFLKRLYTTPKKNDDDSARIKKTYSSHNGLILQREPVEADLDVNIFDGNSLITSSRSHSSSNESFSIPTAGNSSGSSSGSDSNINKAIPSRSEYAALESLLLQGSFNYALATQDLRLPTAWDPKSKGDNIELSGDKLQLTFKGTGKDDVEASSVRANHSMKKQCGIYYFEVQIISKGIDGHIAIGFCRKINSLDRLPGWEEHSWGYHGQNGHKSSGPGTDKSYGPRFTTGDVIGCGVDFRDMSAFYTKNGVHLGVAFKKIKETDLYPFIGFKSPGEKVMANFGSKPFKFDIKQHMLNEKRELIDGIALKPLEPHHSQSTVINHSIAKNLADKLVLDYLRHHGYTKSATALEKKMAALHGGTEWMEEDESVDLDAAHRQEIRQLIFQGNVDKAVEMCNEHYPNVLDENPWIQFKLKCRKFLEMIQSAAKQRKQMGSVNVDQDEYETNSLSVPESEITGSGAKRDNTMADMVTYNNKKKKQKVCEDIHDEMESFRDVMQYGNQLKKEYERLAEEDPVIKDELMKTFSTLAYSDLTHPAVAYLFETPYKEKLALELNSAILVSLNRYPNSSIERIYRQTSTAIEELVLSGNANAALLEPQRDYLNFLS